MPTQTVEHATAAELEFEASLKQLRETIARLPDGERGALAPVQASLVDLDKAIASEDQRCFMHALIGLARAVLEARKTAALSALPVPPYDLWLPFKAGTPRLPENPAEDRYRMAPAGNRKVRIAISEILALLDWKEEDEQPKAQAPQEKPAPESLR